MSCTLCREVGWVLDFRPSKPDPVMLELIACPIPDCEHSGRPVQNLCFPHGPEFTHPSYHPLKGHLMSVSR